MNNTVETLSFGKYIILENMVEKYLCENKKSKIAQIENEHGAVLKISSSKNYTIDLRKPFIDKYDYGQFYGKHLF